MISVESLEPEDKYARIY
jgi:hypothetical protein